VAYGFKSFEVDSYDVGDLLRSATSENKLTAALRKSATKKIDYGARMAATYTSAASIK